MNDRLYRSRDERVFAGVAGGLAARMGVDPSLVRIAWVVLMFLSGGLFFLLYVVMAIVVPEALNGRAWTTSSPGPPGPGAVPGWVAGSGSSSASAAGGSWSAATEPAPPGPAGTTTSPGSPAPAPAWVGPDQRTGPPRRDGRGALVAGIILVLLGAYFLLRMYFPELDLGAFWPLILVAIGVALILGSFRRGPRPGAG